MNNCNCSCHSNSIQICNQNNFNFCYDQQGDIDINSENEKFRIDIFKKEQNKKDYFSLVFKFKINLGDFLDLSFKRFNIVLFINNSYFLFYLIFFL
jgi:hypothetical protein